MNFVKKREIEDQQTKAFSNIIKNAYLKGITDSTITTKEFIEELREQLTDCLDLKAQEKC